MLDHKMYCRLAAELSKDWSKMGVERSGKERKVEMSKEVELVMRASHWQLNPWASKSPDGEIRPMLNDCCI